MKWSELKKKEQKAIKKCKDFRCGTTMNKVFRLPQFCFKADCQIHDFGYRQGGNVCDFVGVNNGFVKRMFIDIHEKDDAYLNKIFYYLMAILYYIAVSIFGIFAFNWTTKQVTVTEMLKKVKCKL